MEQYFRGDGSGEPVFISIPKGSYVPPFLRRPPLPAVQGLPRAGLAAILGVVLLTVLAVTLWPARTSGASAESMDPRLRPLLPRYSRWQFTPMTDAMIGSRFSELARGRGVPAALCYPRHINVREFKSDNFVLLGSRLSLRWAEPFERSLQYTPSWDPQASQAVFKLRQLRPGEPPEYRAAPPRNRPGPPLC